MNTLNIYTHDSFLAHDTGPGHPERPDRLRILQDVLKDYPQIAAEPARLEWIARAHPERHIRAVEEAIPDRGLMPLDNDTVVSPGSWDAALRAAGAVCQAVEDVAAGKCRRAFCAVRPPGHHAEPAQAMGFCLFNNVFIGARHAQEACGLRRVAIVDFDVHHGNGTDTMARAAQDILYISSHQYPLFPMTGHPKDNIDGRILNMLLSAGDGGDAFRALYSDTALPALDAFRPDLLMVSAGFDAHRDDPLAGLTMTEPDFEWITRELVNIAERHARGRMVSVLEGGYDLDALRSSVAAHLKSLNASPMQA